jgi:hypothetical protein
MQYSTNAKYYSVLYSDGWSAIFQSSDQSTFSDDPAGSAVVFPPVPVPVLVTVHVPACVPVRVPVHVPFRVPLLVRVSLSMSVPLSLYLSLFLSLSTKSLTPS